MKATNTTYNFENSLDRIDEILNSSNICEIKDSIPFRDSLTFTNGFYVNCAAIFVDICGSSELTDVHTRPVLAKIYRSFISELVALFNGEETCKEVSINGDCVWGIFDMNITSQANLIVDIAAKASSLIDILNKKLQQKGYQTIEVGIGADYGRALMAKAGYKGSSINDVIWMGDVVNSACHLCGFGNQSMSDCRVMISRTIYNNCCTDYKKLFQWNFNRNCYHGNINNIAMNNWLQKNLQFLN